MDFIPPPTPTSGRSKVAMTMLSEATSSAMSRVRFNEAIQVVPYSPDSPPKEVRGRCPEGKDTCGEIRMI